MSKIALEGNSLGTGTFTIASPNSNTSRTLTLPDNTGTMMLTNTAVAKSQLPAGSVLQVVSGTYATAVSITSTNPTWASASLSASITPSSSSNKVIVFATGVCGIGGAASSLFLTMFRGATNLGNVTGAGSPYFLNRHYSSASGGASGTQFTIMYYDEPSTTSSTTYTLHACVDSGTGYVHRIESGGGEAARSQIILMEIAG
jgi:hypothetical protein